MENNLKKKFIPKSLILQESPLITLEYLYLCLENKLDSEFYLLRYLTNQEGEIFNLRFVKTDETSTVTALKETAQEILHALPVDAAGKRYFGLETEETEKEKEAFTCRLEDFFERSFQKSSYTYVLKNNQLFVQDINPYITLEAISVNFMHIVKHGDRQDSRALLSYGIVFLYEYEEVISMEYPFKRNIIEMPLLPVRDALKKNNWNGYKDLLLCFGYGNRAKQTALLNALPVAYLDDNKRQVRCLKETTEEDRQNFLHRFEEIFFESPCKTSCF